MAIDTEEKRASIAGFIIPSATITLGDRQTIAGKYSGIIAASGASVGPLKFAATAAGAQIAATPVGAEITATAVGAKVEVT